MSVVTVVYNNFASGAPGFAKAQKKYFLQKNHKCCYTKFLSKVNMIFF